MKSIREEADLEIERMADNNILDKKLYGKEQKEILNDLLNYDIQHDVIYDDEGAEFYAEEKNTKHDLTTLRGIIQYIAYKEREYGIFTAKIEIRKALGVR